MRWMMRVGLGWLGSNSRVSARLAAEGPIYNERMPQDWLQAILDPTAPLPNGWRGGALGAFLLFLLPIGSGIPGGVLMAHASGTSPVVTTLLYFLSDVVLALTAEPLLVGGRWLGRHLPWVARLGAM